MADGDRVSAHPGRVKGVLPNVCPTGKLRHPTEERALRHIAAQRSHFIAKKRDLASHVYLCALCDAWHTTRRDYRGPQRFVAPRDMQGEELAAAKRRRARDKERRWRANQVRAVWQRKPGMILDLWALTDSPRWQRERVYKATRDR